jgi:tetratricopeptide (TPR) repeat protein
MANGWRVDEFQSKRFPISILESEKYLSDLEPLRFDEKSLLDQLFSLAEFERGHLLFAQNILRNAIENEPSTSARQSEILLLNALELLSISSLSQKDLQEAGRSLKEIRPKTLDGNPRVTVEYYFWLAEFLRSEHDVTSAIMAYTSALSVDGEAELVRFRRAELYEYQFRYIKASEDFDWVASHAGILRLAASMQRASLLHRMNRNEDLLQELSRAAAIAMDSSHLILSPDSRDLHYHSSFELLAQKSIPQDTMMLASSYNKEEIFLLFGCAYSSLHRFDSAEYYFTKAETSLEHHKDSLPYNGEHVYLSHAVRFEHAWVKLSIGANREAAQMFFALAKDTSADGNTVLSQGTANNTGSFYHDEKNSLGNTKIPYPETIPADTTRFIYDDYPARARFYAGIALSRSGKTDEARDLLTNLSQDPSALYADKARYHLALIEFRSGRMLQAEGLLAPIAMRRTQSGVFASLLLGDIHYRRASYARAAEYFGFVLGNLSDNDTILRSVASLERGLSLLPLGSWQESAEDLKLYVSLSSAKTPGMDEALFWLGRAYFRADSIPQARNCFKRVLEEFPNTSRLIDAQYGYAWTLFRNGEYKDAEREFAKVIEMDSITKYAYDALSRRGDALYANGNLRQALSVYNLAIDRPTFNDYRTTRSLFQTGVLRMLSDSARSAMNAFKTIFTKFPKSDILDRSYYDYAVAAFAIKQDENANEAIRTLTKKIKDSPYTTKSIYLAASEDERDGNYKQAYVSYLKIINDYPSSEEYTLSLFGAINALSQLKKYEEAVDLVDTFLVKNFRASYISTLLYRKGEIQLLASNPKKAKQTFEEFGERFPNDTLLPMSKYLLAKAVSYYDKDKASGLYNDVTEAYPHSNAAPLAYLALARYEKIEKENVKKAAEFYMKSFGMEYYSSEAAPQAMFEYGGFLARKDMGNNPDSAVRIYDELTARYLIETTIGGRAQFEAAEVLRVHGKESEGIKKLDNLAAAQEGYELAAEARLRIGELYRSKGSIKKALNEFDRAREDNSTTKDQLARSYIGSAECHIALGDKKTSRQLLANVLSIRGISYLHRDAARKLLDSITPKKKKKHR